MAINKAIRILVANRPKLMRELILGTLEDQPWVEIVGEVSEDSEILDHVHRTAPDLLVIATDEPGKRPLICDSLLQQHPELRIIAVAAHKNYSVFYWATLDIHSDEIEPSEEGILSAVRSVAATVGGVSLCEPLPNLYAQASQRASFEIHYASLGAIQIAQLPAMQKQESL